MYISSIVTLKILTVLLWGFPLGPNVKKDEVSCSRDYFLDSILLSKIS